MSVEEKRRVTGIAACHGIVPAHIHQLLKSFPVFFAGKRFSETFPPFKLKLQSQTIRKNSFTHVRSLLSVSDVCYVGEYEVLFLEGFVDEVLDGSVQVSIVVGIHDFFFELRHQTGWYSMEC